MNENEYECIKNKIRELIRIDLNNYKANQMMRRLDAFISHNKALNISQYCERLDRDTEEVTRLRNFLTINVTEFYRDRTHFEMLRKIVLPELLSNNPKLHIWSAGCSDGEEPYSLAVMLDELTPGVKHHIIATDIDKESLNKAASGGPYQPLETRNIPQQYLGKYFFFSNDSYWVKEQIRERITFFQHDLTQNTFPTSLDLIICRNVTIYFSNQTKRLLNLKFLNSLKENGILFIGATETMLDADEIGFQRMFPCFYKKNTISLSRKPKKLSTAILSR
jgi:chemotaxis protein methyltransferase CheR